MPLTREQFEKAQQAGFSTDQIIEFEKRRRSSGVSGSWDNQPDQLSTKNPIKAAVKSASEIIPGTLYATQYWKGRISGLNHAEAMQNAERVSAPIEQAKVEGVPSQIAYGAVQAAPLVAGVAQPFMAGAAKIGQVGSKIPLVGRVLGSKLAQGAAGFGAYEATRQAVSGNIQNIPEAAAGGAIGGLTFGVGGKLGATAAQPLAKYVGQNIARRIGSGVGAGAASALMAPEGEKVSSAVLGAGFGAKYPSEPIKGKSPEVLRNEATAIYRDMLRPTQGEVKKVEGKLKKNMNDFYKLAAEEQLPIKRTSDNKLDTIEAQSILKDRVGSIHKELNGILRESNKTFDLESIRSHAKARARKAIRPAKDTETINRQIDEYIDAEIRQNGSNIVNAEKFNNIKQSMWDVGYDILQPTSKKSANLIGRSIKSTIEKSFTDTNIKGMNDLSGKYQTLKTLLENAQGRDIKGGRLGDYVGRMLGGTVGGLGGQIIPIPGVGSAVGAMVGQQLGANISYEMTSPERAVRRASKKINQARKKETIPLVRATPVERSMGQINKATATDVYFEGQKRIPMSRKPLELPAPKPAGQGKYGAEGVYRGIREKGIRMGSSGLENAPIRQAEQSTIYRMPIPELEQYIQGRYSAGATQKELNALETLYARRSSGEMAQYPSETSKNLTKILKTATPEEKSVIKSKSSSSSYPTKPNSGSKAGVGQNPRGSRRIPLKAEKKAGTGSKAKTSEYALIEEAKKYKTAEEFVNYQPTFYHTTSSENALSIEKNGFKPKIGERSLGVANAKGTWLYENDIPTKEFGKNFKNPNTIEAKVNGKIFDATNEDRSIRAIVEDKKFINNLKKQGFVGVKGDELGTSATFIFEPSAIKTKSQLTSIWNKAHSKKIIPSKKEIIIKNNKGEVGPDSNLIQEAKKYKTAEEFEKSIISKLAKPDRGMGFVLSGVDNGKPGISVETYKNVGKRIIFRDNDGKPVGGLIIGPVGDKQMILHAYVKQEQRGAGIGSALIKKAYDSGAVEIYETPTEAMYRAKLKADTGSGSLTSIWNKAHSKKTIPLKKSKGKIIPLAAGVIAASALTGNAQAANDEMLKRHEGWRSSVYTDTEGHKTIGYGFNIDEPSVRKLIPQDVLSGKRQLTKQEAEPIYQKLVNNATKDAENFVGRDIWNSLSKQRKDVIINMAYNLGADKLSGFEEFKKNLIRGDFNRAAHEMIDSKWYRQVKGRGKELVSIMRGKK